jgi:acyl carrier protein
MEAATTPQSAEKWMLDALGAQSGMRDGIDRNTRIKDLDIDSLDLIEIWTMLDEELGVAVDPTELRQSETVGEALDLIKSQLP